ncbi:hypothetical protein JTE90_015231 [Oedothorax gibbosus]|uniref:Uncharacterized protein n=1 Tax=Oedothorax gibbosus TaxID=931172 RepID=A0AAV6V9R1_9ARAC|nr:hypothetical protein JTE90_015231 [Oedothorax gibbosus]
MPSTGHFFGTLRTPRMNSTVNRMRRNPSSFSEEEQIQLNSRRNYRADYRKAVRRMTISFFSENRQHKMVVMGMTLNACVAVPLEQS